MNTKAGFVKNYVTRKLKGRNSSDSCEVNKASDIRFIRIDVYHKGKQAYAISQM